MSSLYLLKPGELTLKGGNRPFFERLLQKNLAAMLKGSGAQIRMTRGRFYLHCPPEAEAQAEEALSRLFGIAGWAKTRECEKTMEAVIAAAVEEGKQLYAGGARSFKIEAKRTDKSFPHDSYTIRCQAGEAVAREVPGLRVDVRKPEGIIEVEIRERAFVFGNTRQGRQGLPVGSAGKGLLLLSGGIDSPVAGYMMASRGMTLEAVYFHAFPYTSDEARQKTIDLARVLGTYTQGLKLFVISCTAIQGRIKEGAPEAWRTVILRMAMMDCAEKLALKRRARCLISGESLSQVASQTIENISCTQSLINLPVLQPLIGINKERITALAEEIGTYKISILPYEDCCVLFTPPHPIIRGDPQEAKRIYLSLDLEELIKEGLEKAEMIDSGATSENYRRP
ncbi:MAG: tRNA 4-thiouridine(8) synthase ThiI [Treponema sp.]|nr:tRNA 4-thiouridine(8) synthase ThiI [Treponema sp.]